MILTFEVKIELVMYHKKYFHHRDLIRQIHDILMSESDVKQSHSHLW